ncbi:uncharacterized protein EDB91DRAFT_1160580 [Suillus paluster]|uniref:uncharacterized protein n=1 Tax=Suillus paluster TaxID=48578 RepID=UPI001B8675F7|nr:uncharacterized protein EDB91DRAFT_1160580 [Suillus paluster]KAG1728853.1 hypothetical protein EDB91DRAFT_1160580 [Suillus paluster]
MPSPLAVTFGSNSRDSLPDNTRRGTPPMSLLSPSHAVSFENMLRQFRKLSAPSCNSSLPQTVNYPLVHLDSVGPNCMPRSANSQPPSPLAHLGAPFVPVSCQMSDDLDIGSPIYHRFHNDSHLDLSPTSSGSSEAISLPSPREFPGSRSSFEQFRNTRSRVLHLQKDHRWPLPSFVSFFKEGRDRHALVRPPMAMWAVNESVEPNDVWAMFQSHEDACTTLSLSHPSITIVPALESDLEPFDRLRRVDSVFKKPVFSYPAGHNLLRMSLSTPDLHKCVHVGTPTFVQSSMGSQNDDFVISSNPPNPRTTFRLGDWICNSPNCAAHNFGRNLACRGCGCPRSDNQPSTMQRQGSCGPPASRLPVSPRFVNPSGHAPMSPSPLSPSLTSPLYPSVGHNVRHAPHPIQPSMMSAKPPSPTHPLLTPSGRSFAVGGKVQNISSDPLSPCVMYWPDNESFPEQGQIRPSSLMVAPPPILNTGNRGPIEHQPGDWICQKCNYLNWRRRKVCQTCFPYAEGNGDSISAAVQAERINLLTSLLAQNQLPLASGPVSLPSQASRSHSMTPPQRRRMFMDNIHQNQVPYRSRSHSNFDLSTQYSDSQFIYETSAPRRASPSSFPSLGDLEDCLPANIPAPLLPSFLQDIVQSPTLSPSSTSSADLSPEDYDDSFSSGRSSFGKERITTNDSSLNLPVSNIWKLNDEETKGIAGVALPNIGVIGSRRSSHEVLRRRSNSP